MPKVEVSKEDLEKLVGQSIEKNLLMDIKCEIDREEGDLWVIEVADTNRPDLWSAEGIARELKGVLGIEKGPVKYKFKKKIGKVKVDKKVTEIRPYIACAAVKNVDLGKNGFEQLIQLQEKIMHTYGRKRKKVAIGTSDLDLITFPINYIAAGPEDYKFVPLYENVEMTLGEILERTEKGREYSWILDGFEKYPLLVDKEGNVISFPPIINSNDIGRIDEDTENIFIDVTGTEWGPVKTALNVIVSALAERGGEIWFVEIEYPNKKIVTPVIEQKTVDISLKYFNKIAGLELDKKEFKELLEKMRYDVKKISGDVFKVVPPFYRGDIMHERDIVEDVLIAIGYNNIPPREIPYATAGGPTEEEELKNAIRELMVGAGFQEVLTFSLTDPEIFKKAKIKPVVVLENPVSAKFTILRPSLLPCLLDFLSENKDERHPQKVFEIGEVVQKDATPTGCSTKTLLSAVIASSDVDYTGIRKVLEFFLDSLSVKYSFKPEANPLYLEGRSAVITVAGEVVGALGEIDPEVLENFGIEVPVAGFEVELDKIKRFI